MSAAAVQANTIIVYFCCDRPTILWYLSCLSTQCLVYHVCCVVDDCVVVNNQVTVWQFICRSILSFKAKSQLFRTVAGHEAKMSNEYGLTFLKKNKWMLPTICSYQAIVAICNLHPQVGISDCEITWNYTHGRKQRGDGGTRPPRILGGGDAYRNRPPQNLTKIYITNSTKMSPKVVLSRKSK